MKPTVAVLYSDAGAAALIDAMKHWRKDHAPSASYDSLLTEHIEQVRTDQRIYSAGRSRIIVAVVAKRRSRSDTYYYEAQLSGGQLKLEKITD